MGLRIGVIGVGGVGGYFGSKLCRLISARGAEVYFIARGAHLDAIRQNGLLVQTATEGEWTCKPTLATDDFQALPVLDLCLVCVKSYDLQSVSPRLRHCVSDGTFIIPLLNGVDIYERMRRELDVARIFPACTYIGTHIASPGKIAQRGGDCKIQLGADPQAPGVQPQSVFEIFAQSGIAYEWFDDISSELWRKYIFIASLGVVQASFEKTLGQVMESPELSRYLQLVMEEITALGRSKGVELPDDIVAVNCRRARTFAYKTKTSFQRDFERADRPDERDILTGTILRLGVELGVDTPVSRKLAEILEQKKPGN
ncbi:MAG TPA: 2-dehydropantoate 2-reductase [Acidobacteriota bacterium]|nr:2-dehydropantoate 2-reductase [Acidobacteriota bacterium]